MKKNWIKLWILLCGAVFSLMFSITVFAAVEVTLSGNSNYADAYEAFQETNSQRTANGKSTLNMNPQLQKLLCKERGKLQC